MSQPGGGVAPAMRNQDRAGFRTFPLIATGSASRNAAQDLTLNIQRPTFNRADLVLRWMLNVQCWMLDVFQL
jgi:hypothetical protein